MKREPDDYDGSEPLANPRWERFCQGILQSLPARKAYKQAGYKASDAVLDSASSRLLKNMKVSRRVAFMMSQVANEVCVDVAYVVRGFKNIADVCSRPKSREGGLVDAAAANKALDCLAKVTGAYLADNSQKNEGWLEYQEWINSD